MGLLNKKNPGKLEVYLECIPIIDKLKADGRLSLDIKKNHAQIDLSVHLMMMGTDTQYSNFLDKLQAYVNFERGRKQGELKRLKKDSSEWDAFLEKPLTFDVIQNQVRYVDVNSGEPLPEKMVYKAVIFQGSYLNGRFELNP